MFWHRRSLGSDGPLVRYRHHLVHFERVTGGVLVLTGIVFFFGFFTLLNNWMLEAFPGLGQLG
jgi:cytochrome c-type biogenesis protein